MIYGNNDLFPEWLGWKRSLPQLGVTRYKETIENEIVADSHSVLLEPIMV